jgi:hypothetical protein
VIEQQNAVVQQLEDLLATLQGLTGGGEEDGD